MKAAREAHAGLLEALRRGAIDGAFREEDGTETPACGTCGTRAPDCDDIDGEDGSEVCPGRGHRAALDAWEHRQRLRDDPGMRNVLRGLLRPLHWGDMDLYIDDAADAIEAYLLGGVPQGGGEEG